jgi:hypothetical protein
MPGFKFLEEFSDWSRPALAGIFQALPDAFPCVRASGDVEQTLVGFRILHHGCSFSIHSQHHGTLALLDLLEKVAGPPTKGGQRLDVLC